MRDLFTLPDPVIERLEQRGAQPRADLATRSSFGAICEARRSADPRIEVRSNDDGTVGLAGYASVYDFAYDVAGGPDAGGWSEVIKPGAFAQSLARGADVRCLFNHSGLPIARTKSGTMQLRSDDIGLQVDIASLDLTSPHVKSIVSAMERGDIDSMSFAFRAVRQDWNATYTERRIHELQVFDVSVVDEPANPLAAVAVDRRNEPVVAECRTHDLATARAIAEQLRLRAR